MIEPGGAVLDSTESAVRRAVARKKRQVRAVPHPVILAVQARGLCSDFDDFRLALYGRSVAHCDETGQVVRESFDPDGAFATRRREAPTYAAVLAFLGIGVRTITPPMFFLHPRYTGPLPVALNRLARCSFDPRSMLVSVQPAPDIDYVDALWR